MLKSGGSITVANILEDAEPRVTKDTKANKRDTIISDTLGKYRSSLDEPMNEIDLSQRRSSDEEKLNR
tara:strand:- start:207 stop:410 length:204 start_codon:yes stop_codon:yes gene_type:complete